MRLVKQDDFVIFSDVSCQERLFEIVYNQCIFAENLYNIVVIIVSADGLAPY